MKDLYTALTRARVNILIFDTNKEKRAPMFEYFKARKLVRCITQEEKAAIRPTGDTIFGKKSTPEDWEKRGDEMMGRFLYEVAAKCYRMGNKETKEKIALAHNQALKASRMKDNPKKMREEFVFAAEKFMESGHDNKAALCLQNAKEYELAARLLEKCGQLEDAAEMYRRVKKYKNSSRCYEQLGNYHKAVEVLDKGELYVQAIDCLERYNIVVTEYERKGQEVPQPLLKNNPGIVFKVANLVIKAGNFSHINKNKSKMMEALERLPRVEDKLELLKKRGYMEQAATILMTEGRTTEAARMMLQHGKTEKALQFAEFGEDQDVLGDCHYAQALAFMSSKEDFNQEKIIGHLNSAKDAFTKMKNPDSVGVAYLDMASIKMDIKIAKKAFLSFKEVKPFDNEVGKLEALDLVVKLSSMDEEFGDIKAVIRGVDALFAVMKALLKPTSIEEKSKVQFYLQFYGLHKKDVHTLVVYPKQSPRCVRVIPNFYCTKLEKKQPSVDKDKEWGCVKISFHLVTMLKTWISKTKLSMKSHITRRLQCKSHMEGEECPDKDYCPYLHKDYRRQSAFHALDALLWEVHLDSILQSGVMMIKTLSIRGFESEVKNLHTEISSLIEEDTQFNSCERLLDFLMPENHHMNILSENAAVMSNLQSRLFFGKVHVQVHRYLDNCWCQGENLTQMQVLEKRSKSTDWFVRATLFASIFRLKLDIKKECHKLEGELMKFTPKWLNKQRKYALLAEFFRHTLTVECLGRKFCSAYSWLQEKPLKAIIEYAKFVEILGERGRLSLFPKMPLFLFWQEVFVTVSFCHIAKLLSVSASFYIPATYLATIPFLNATFPGKDLSIQELIHKSFDRKDNIQVVKDRFRHIAGVLCGQRMNLLRMIFTKNKDGSEIQYLQAERCLVLALVVLVNMGPFVPIEIENPLMSTVVNLSLSKDAPLRLRKTLEAMQTSKGYVDLVATLKELLFKREKDFLLVCNWKWDTRWGQGVQFRQLQRVDGFSKRFYVFDPENPLPEDEDLFQEEYEDELGLTEEEAKKCQEEHFEYENDLKRDKSAKKLQRFFRWLTLKNRLESGMFNKMCQAQEMKEFLAPFEVNERMCGVCGIRFQSDELSMKDISEELIEGDEATGQQSPSVLEAETKTLSDAAKSLWSPGRQNTQFEAHKITSEHVKRKFQFEVFKRLHEDYFVQKIPEMRKFITKMRLKDQDFTAEHYQDQALDVSRLTSQMDDILVNQKAILNTRNWEKATSLRDKVVRMYDDYKSVGPEIVAKYKEFLEKQKLREDSQLEDWEPEILEVVDEPAPRRKEPQMRAKGGGGGAGRGRARNQARGDWEQENSIGQGWARGRGRQTHRRDINDLPLRFQRARLQQLNQQYQEKRHHVPN